MTAVAVSENVSNAKVEECFGKSEYFFIIDEQNKKSYFAKNPAKGLPKNSGKEAALFLIKEGVTTVISANFGVAVKRIFDKNKVQMVIISPDIESLNDIKWISNNQ